MALTPEVRSSQAGALALTQTVSPEVRALQVSTMALGIFPTEEIRSSQVGAFALVSEHTKEMRVPQVTNMILARGRIKDPRVRAWTFTLDGHDFYLLNVGDEETLVYDASTGEWYTWGNDELDVFQAKVGINWTGNGRIAPLYGSNVLIGHDSAGTVMVLDPDGDVDEHPTEGDSILSTFRRRLTAQRVVPAGYDFPPCYGIQLFGSVGDNGVNVSDDELTIRLEFSDDRGNSWTDVGTLAPPDEDYDFRLNWQSLGSMRAPGRLFRVTDYGAMKRIDGLELEDGIEE